MAIKLLEKIPDIHLTIYEKNEEVGGTWFENKYPGCACGISQQPSRLLRARLKTRRHTSTLLSIIVRVESYLEPILRNSAGDLGILETGHGEIWSPKIH